MKGFVYRCPATGEELQAFHFADSAGKDGHIVELCRACGQIHVIDAETGEVKPGRPKREVHPIDGAAA